MNGGTISLAYNGAGLPAGIRYEGSSPWAAEAPAARVVAPMVMPEAEHVIEFHVVGKGDRLGNVGQDGNLFVSQHGALLCH